MFGLNKGGARGNVKRGGDDIKEATDGVGGVLSTGNLKKKVSKNQLEFDKNIIRQ